MGETKIEIVKPTTADAALLAALSAQTFAETFVGMQYYTQEIVDGYTSQTFTPERVAEQVADPKVRWWLMRVGGEAAGYAKLVEREPASCVRDLRAIYLERIYFAKKFHRRGLGKLLLNEVYREARARGYPWLWLSVWEFNVNAVKFYERLGFTRAGEWEWKFTDAKTGKAYVDIDWVMTIRVPAPKA